MKRTFASSALVCIVLMSSRAGATNGMNPIASGAQAAGRGGVDQAIATETSAMNTNPAGITQAPMRIDGTLTLLMPSLKLSDSVTMPGGTMPLNQDVSGESKVFPLVNVGITANLLGGLYGGIGIMTQGGMGAEFKGLSTGPAQPGVPATYDIYSQIMFMKVTPTLAYRVEEPGFAFSVGASLNIGGSQMNFRHGGMPFPVGPGMTLYGLKFESDWASGWGVRGGALLELLDKHVTAGVSYQSKANLTYKGTATIGGMADFDGQMEFAWPQQMAGGVAVRPFGKLLLGADITWINWQETMGTVPLTLTGNGQTMTLPFKMNWRDQVVYALGAEYEIIPLLVGRVGYNYGRSPVRSDGLNPLFPAVSEHHVTLGAGLRPIPDKLFVDAALEISPRKTVTSDATNQLAYQPGTTTPNGYSTSVAMSQISVHLGAGVRF